MIASRRHSVSWRLVLTKGTLTCPSAAFSTIALTTPRGQSCKTAAGLFFHLPGGATRGKGPRPVQLRTKQRVGGRPALGPVAELADAPLWPPAHIELARGGREGMPAKNTSHLQVRLLPGPLTKLVRWYHVRSPRTGDAPMQLPGESLGVLLMVVGHSPLAVQFRHSNGKRRPVRLWPGAFSSTNHEVRK